MFKHIAIEPKPDALGWRLDGANSADVQAEIRLAKAAPDLLQALRRARNWIAMYDEDTSGEDPAAKVMLDAIDKALAEVL
jgi:hypothetical protein